MLTPEEIASRQFLIALRGYDRDEVTAFLGRVSDEYRQLLSRVENLESDVQRIAAERPPAADEGTEPREALRLLGEETTRILLTAEEAARAMRHRADEEARAELEAARRTAQEELENAQRTAEQELQNAHRTAQEELDTARRTAQEELETARRTANDELQRARRTAQEEMETARRTAATELQEARTAATQERETAQREAQQMVEEATRRRDEVMAAIRELEAARAELAGDLDAAVRAVDQAIGRIRTSPVAELDLSAQEPITIEMPTRAPAQPEGRREAEARREPEGRREAEPRREPEGRREAEAPSMPGAGAPPMPPQTEDVGEPAARAAGMPTGPAMPAGPGMGGPSGGPATAGMPGAPAAAGPMGGPGGEPEGGRGMEMEAGREPAAEGDRAVGVQTQARPGVADAAARQLRDQALAGVRPAMLRRLKRTLQDVQNGVLDALRRSDGQVDPSQLPPFADDLAPLGSLGEAFLAEAYRAGIGDGAALAGVPRREDAADPARVEDAARTFRDTLAYEIDASLEATLRAGLEAGENTTALAERVAEIFRDLKGPVSEAAVDASLVRIYELGVHDAWRQAGVESRVWVVGEEARCPENRCRVNAAEGPIALDAHFPSGDFVPPAHPGCTCTVAPA